jgi:hypothetical protein
MGTLGPPIKPQLAIPVVFLDPLHPKPAPGIWFWHIPLAEARVPQGLARRHFGAA